MFTADGKGKKNNSSNNTKIKRTPHPSKTLLPYSPGYEIIIKITEPHRTPFWLSRRRVPEKRSQL